MQEDLLQRFLLDKKTKLQEGALKARKTNAGLVSRLQTFSLDQLQALYIQNNNILLKFENFHHLSTRLQKMQHGRKTLMLLREHLNAGQAAEPISLEGLFATQVYQHQDLLSLLRTLNEGFVKVLVMREAIKANLETLFKAWKFNPEQQSCFVI